MRLERVTVGYGHGYGIKQAPVVSPSTLIHKT